MTRTTRTGSTGARVAEPPVIVVEGDAAAFDAVVAEVRQAGWRVASGFEAPIGGVGVVLVGAVDSPADAAAALLAVLGGAGAIIHGRASPATLDRLLDDLRHVRRVEVRRGSLAGPAPIAGDALAILAILAEGRTLGDAALTLGLSRRTADRRLAEARRALGAERTVEAVARARRLGWLE